jgi:hypothetical protein
MDVDLTPRNLPNPLNTSFARPTLMGNSGAFERYESPYRQQDQRFAPLQFAPQTGYSLGLADRKLNAALPSTKQRFGNRINYDWDEKRKQKRYGATFSEPFEMGLTRPGTGRSEPFQEIPYTFLDKNAERYDSIGGKRLGKQTVEQAQRNVMGGASLGFEQPSLEGYSLTDGNVSITPQLLKALRAEGFSVNEIFGYFDDFAERQKMKNLLLFIIIILLFGLLVK